MFSDYFNLLTWIIRLYFFLQLTPNGEPDLKALYDEELAVAQDAI